jgi:hypothetical protein
MPSPSLEKDLVIKREKNPPPPPSPSPWQRVLPELELRQMSDTSREAIVALTVTAVDKGQR